MRLKPIFQWGSMDRVRFVSSINLCYDEVLRNLFQILYGKVIVSEMAHLFKPRASGKQQLVRARL